MANTPSQDDSAAAKESAAAIKLWFNITMACTVIFVAAVFLFII